MRMDGFEQFLREFSEAMFTDRISASQRRAILERSTRMRAEDARALRANMMGWDAAVFESALKQVQRFSIPLSVIQTTRTDAVGRHALKGRRVNALFRYDCSTCARSRHLCDAGRGHFPNLSRQRRLTVYYRNLSIDIASPSCQNQIDKIWALGLCKSRERSIMVPAASCLCRRPCLWLFEAIL
jgi:hypothetical protein